MSIVTIRTQCRMCPRITRTDVDEMKLEMFMQRLKAVQTLFPKHNADEREAIMGHRSGYYLCPVCWPEDEEGDEG